MAEQTFGVNCGFFDAINDDRTYSAEDMNRPYKRIVADGVFATNQGTPSSDLQVVSTGSGMDITVQVGQGIFGSKWFENPSPIIITVPANNEVYGRIDSVIVQVDKRSSGRVGNIVYRTGTPNATPAPPEIGTVASVIEYRIANVEVAAGANAITDDLITDLRGSEECPWVTGLITQVDTSGLWRQFQTAYQQQYETYTEEYETYTAEKQRAFEDWLSSLTEQLNVSTNIIAFTSTYTAQGTVSNIPINIASYNPNTDLLLVYINGLMALGKYTLNNNNTSIDLTNPIAAGNSVYFVCLHSIIAADLESAVSMIQALNTKLSQFMSDSGWIDFLLENGAEAYDSDNVPGVRAIGGKIYLRGAFKNLTTLGETVCSLPYEYRPAQDEYITTCAVSGTLIEDSVLLRVSAADGSIKLAAASSGLSASAMIPLSGHFLSANPVVSVISDNSLENADEERF